MTGNVVISEVYARVHAVLSKDEKHVPDGAWIGTIDCTTL
jgi:hypothetical protein